MLFIWLTWDMKELTFYSLGLSIVVCYTKQTPMPQNKMMLYAYQTKENKINKTFATRFYSSICSIHFNGDHFGN